MEVRARAPGKIILAGEHAVVHGSTAVAASIDLYTYVSLGFPTPSDNDDTIKLHLKDVDLEFSWSVGRIKEVLPDMGSHTASSPSSCSLETIKAISALVEEQNIPEAKIGLASGVSTFLWLYTSIHGYKPAKAVVTSELPLGSGLATRDGKCFGESELELVNKWAFEGEKIFHGKPSGIDNTVSTYGNMIKFRSGELTRIKTNMPLKMLITNTKVGRNTKALVDSISSELASIIESPVSDDLAITEKEEKLEELMEMNQGLLQCMGVSHASIETVLRTTLKYKLSSKLTGAGGGGCVLTLLPNLLSGTVVEKVIEELESSGFQCLIAGIGGGGMEISFSGST
ncbi:Mevalonate kinase [Abeliophyllum distichum]|uniref:Mevalonate kinase n=1 Tax=Abeliophyllum distichum TaxID=126358 RepID=A0ABD1RR48_9LAMI